MLFWVGDFFAKQHVMRSCAEYFLKLFASTLWGSVIYIMGVVCLVALCYLEATQASNPDAIADGAEMQSYADQGKCLVEAKLRIMQVHEPQSLSV